jgi:hypothetical protein
MKDQIRPNIAKLSATLAADNARVFRFVDGLVRRLDNLAAAVQSEDWTEVHRLSDYIVRSGGTFGHNEVAKAAEAVCDATQMPNNGLEIRRQVLALMGACGRE